MLFYDFNMELNFKFHDKKTLILEAFYLSTRISSELNNKKNRVFLIMLLKKFDHSFII